jgi:hypothetical protein
LFVENRNSIIFGEAQFEKPNPLYGSVKKLPEAYFQYIICGRKTRTKDIKMIKIVAGVKTCLTFMMKSFREETSSINTNPTKTIFVGLMRMINALTKEIPIK